MNWNRKYARHQETWHKNRLEQLKRCLPGTATQIGNKMKLSAESVKSIIGYARKTEKILAVGFRDPTYELEEK